MPEIEEKLFCIRNTKTGDYWSDFFGWVEEEPISLYTEPEKEDTDLPMEGKWEVFLSPDHLTRRKPNEAIKVGNKSLCPKCGWHFATHNDDGSCVQD